MILKFLSKYILEVIPSILATVVGAYIVTHYINAKSDPDKPKTEASAPVTTSAPLRAAGQDSRKESAKAALVPDDQTRALEKPSADKPLVEKTSLEKPAEIAVEPRRQPVMKGFLKRKTVVKASPDSGETVVAPSDDRDANDLARAAIERLRNADQSKDKDAPKEAAKPAEASRVQEAVRTPEPIRMPEPAHPPQDRSRANAAVYTPAPIMPVAPVAPMPAQTAPAQTAAVPALPPATVVAPEKSLPATSSVTRVNDPSRPTPPADIPTRPLDLRASAAAQDNSSVADDVVAAAKTMFKSVLPDNH